MRNMLLLFCLATAVLSLSCYDNTTISGTPEESYTYDDLIGTWRGTMDAWWVSNTTQHPSYGLHDVDIKLIIGEQNYWLSISQFSDTLEYQYYNRGYWLWDPYSPDEIVFEMYYEYSTQIFNPIRSSSNPGDSEGNTETPPDTIIYSKGDNTELEERFASYIDINLEEESIRLWDFVDYLNLGDITLSK